MAITVNALMGLLKKEREVFEKKESKYTMTESDKLREIRTEQIEISQNAELERRRQEILQQQAVQQSILQSSSLQQSYNTATSPIGMATNITGQLSGNSGLGNGISWSSTSYRIDYNSMNDSNKAKVIAAELEGIGLTDVSNQTMYLALKILSARNNNTSTPEVKQPRKKLEL